MAGTVLAVGDKVTRFSAGDNVVSIAGRTLAERGVFKQELVIPMPASLDFETASGVCLTYFTSYHALKQRAAIQRARHLCWGQQAVLAQRRWNWARSWVQP
jgi:NADPH2:quinone reductase